MNSSTGIKLFSPACISMLSYGLKDISIAIEKPGNEIYAKINNTNKSVEFKTYTKEKNDTLGVKDNVLVVANEFFNALNRDFGVTLEIFNRIPFQSGLGELESNITGVILALNSILNGQYKELEIFDFILNSAKKNKIDLLPSSVAACIFGGVILYNDNLHTPIQKLYVPHGLNLTIIEKRNKINKSIFENISSLELFEQSKNNAGFIKSLFTTDHDLLSNSLKNNVFDDKIGANISWYNDIKQISYKNEVYSIGFCHFGETAFIINPNTLIKDENHKDMEAYFTNNNIKANLIETVINLNGVFKY